MPQDNRRRRRSIENYQNDTPSHVPQRQHEHHHSPHRLSKTIFFWLLLSLVVFAIVGGKYLEKKLNNAPKLPIPSIVLVILANHVMLALP